MKHVITASLAIVLGLVLGGLPARSEVRSMRRELHALQKRDCGVGRGLGSMFQGGPMMMRADEVRAAVSADAGPPDGARAATTTPAPPPRAAPVAQEAPSEAPSRVELGREALDIRRTQARAALLEEANPDRAQLETFDAAVEEMNGELHDLARIFVDDFARTDREPSRHELMVFAADTLDVLITAGDRMKGALSEEQQRGVSEESIDPLSYVDPALADLLAEIDR